MGGFPRHLADISIDDWDALLCAVKDRLRQTVGESLTQPMNGSAMPVRASVLECVEALDQLHNNLKGVLAAQPPIDLRSPQRTAAADDPSAAAPSAPTTAVAATGPRAAPA